MDTVLSSKSNNWLLSNVTSRILCSEQYICKYTLYFRLLQSQLTKLKASFLLFFLFKIKTLGKHHTSTHAHVHAATNVALQRTVPKIALPKQILLAHRENHYGITVARRDFHQPWDI